MLDIVLKKRTQRVGVVLALFVLSALLTANTAFGATELVKAGTSDTISIASGTKLEVSSNALNDYAEEVKAEKEVWELQMKAEEEEKPSSIRI